MSAVTVLAEFVECPYIDQVDGPLHSGCRWCAEREQRGVDDALRNLRLLEREVARFCGRLEAPEYLREALRRVEGRP